MEDFLATLIVGFFGGFAGGLLGIGGGAIYVPALVIALDEPQHLAQGASLAAVVATSIVGGLTHLRRGNVDTTTVVWVAPVAIVAGFGAAILAGALDATVLRRIFAIVMLYFAANMILGALRTEHTPTREGEAS